MAATGDDRAHPATPADSGDVTWRLLEQAPDGVVVVDETGRILMANHRTEQLFGYDEGTLQGNRVDVLLPPRWHAAYAAQRERATDAAQRARPVDEPSSRLRAALRLDGLRQDGSELPVEMSMSPVRSEIGLRVVVVVREAPAPGGATARRFLRRHPAEPQPAAAFAARDTALDDVVAAGLELQSLARGLHGSTAARLLGVVGRLDDAARHLRAGALDAARPTPPPATSLAGLVREATHALAAGTAPSAAGSPPALEALAHTPLAAILREILSKLASQEARAPATVHVTVSHTVRIDVGSPGAPGAEHPAARFAPRRGRRPRPRLEALGGRVTVDQRTADGTRASWTVALPPAGPDARGGGGPEGGSEVGGPGERGPGTPPG